jgi:hypothetical protein
VALALVEVVVREDVVRVGEAAVDGARERVRVDGARDRARGLGIGWGSGDGGAVEGSASSSVSEKGELGKTFERRVAQRSGRRVLNLRNCVRGKSKKDQNGTITNTYSRSTMSSANICIQSLSSVLDFGFPVCFSALRLDLGLSRAPTSCQVDSLSMYDSK